MKRQIREWIENLAKAVLERSRLTMILATLLAEQRNRAIRHRVEANLLASGEYGDEIQQGPFRGLSYPPNEDWAAARFQKVIGFYEIELQAPIEQLIAEKRPYTDIIIAGAAEGYYTVGLGHHFPQAAIHSFEIQAHRREFLERFAKLNQLNDRVTNYGYCDPQALNQLKIGKRPLVVCDVEGYEEILMDPKAVTWLTRADIILELHDNFVPGIQTLIRSRFGDSHEIERFSENGVPYNQFPLLNKLLMSEILALTASERVCIQNWFIMHTKNAENTTT